MRRTTLPTKSPILRKSPNRANGCSSGFPRNAKTPLRSLVEGNGGLGDLKAAIKSAALAEDLVGKSYRNEWNGKVKLCHGHQRRIKQAALQKALLGSLYIYDTSLRISAFSKKLPKRMHLQAGALTGARALKLDVNNSPLPVGAYEIEDSSSSRLT